MNQQSLELLAELMVRPDFRLMMEQFVEAQKAPLLEMMRDSVRNGNLHDAMGFQGQLSALESLLDLMEATLTPPRK